MTNGLEVCVFITFTLLLNVHLQTHESERMHINKPSVCYFSGDHKKLIIIIIIFTFDGLIIYSSSVFYNSDHFTPLHLFIWNELK